MKSSNISHLTKKHQVISILAALSNCNQKIIRKTEEELQTNLTGKVISALQNPTIKSYIGNWDLVWGPCTKNTQLVKDNKIVPDEWLTDNAMFVLKGQDPEDDAKTLYVVSVSGNNLYSLYGWFDEDFKVATHKMQNWGTVPGAMISEGSNDGLTILKGLKDSKNQDIFSFISQLSPDKDTEVATCGHSLAGTLCPLLALSIIEWKEKEDKSFLVSAYPSAGATSGNTAFVKYAESKFGDNYHSVINNYDIVPLAWNAKTLLQIPELYSTPAFAFLSFPEKAEQALISSENHCLKDSDYTRIFDGQPQEYRFDGNPSGSATTFVAEAGFQHIIAYNSPNAFYYDDGVAEAVNKYLGN
jgi:Lipase (class 3)